MTPARAFARSIERKYNSGVDRGVARASAVTGVAAATFRPASYSDRPLAIACDKASPNAFIALHTRARYVSKAAI